MTITINGTTGIAGVDGSASVPAFKGNDTDTGIFYPTANEVAAAAGGSTVWNAASTFGFKNRIINGAMVIDQRNAGASVTGTNTLVFPVDRWASFEDSDGVMTFQRSTNAPPGFSYSVIATTTTADSSLSASQRAVFVQRVEGFNIADFGWGTANAQTVTLSFWVRSSLTGTFGGALTNLSRSYGFSYTISAANTWEYKTVTISGDTSGTWDTTNGLGVQITFGLGVGSNFVATAGAWSAGDLNSVSGAVSVIGTLNATWQVTGVQFEKGSTATSFDFRSYGTELALCQRYLPVSESGTATGAGPIAVLQWISSTAFQAQYYFQVNPRVPPTGITISSANHFLANYAGTANPTVTGLTFSEGTLSGCSMTGTVASGGGTAGLSGYLRSNSTASAKIQFTGCEL